METSVTEMFEMAVQEKTKRFANDTDGFTTQRLIKMRKNYLILAHTFGGSVEAHITLMALDAAIDYRMKIQHENSTRSLKQ